MEKFKIKTFIWHLRDLWLKKNNIYFSFPGPGVLDDGLYDDAEPSTLEEELGNGKGGDERTEIILAATFLLIVILSFIA